MTTDPTNCAWVPRAHMPAWIAPSVRHPYLPVPMDDYLAGYWRDQDYVPSIQLPAGYDWPGTLFAPSAIPDEASLAAAADFTDLEEQPDELAGRQAAVVPITANDKEHSNQSRAGLLGAGGGNIGANALGGVGASRARVTPTAQQPGASRGDGLAGGAESPGDSTTDEPICTPGHLLTPASNRTIITVDEDLRWDLSSGTPGPGPSLGVQSSTTMPLVRLPGVPLSIRIDVQKPYILERSCTCESVRCVHKMRVLPRLEYRWTILTEVDTDCGFIVDSFADDNLRGGVPARDRAAPAVLLLPPKLDRPQEGQGPSAAVIDLALKVRIAVGGLPGGSGPWEEYAIRIAVRRDWGTETGTKPVYGQVGGESHDVADVQDRYYYNITTGRLSPWPRDDSGIDSGGLAPSACPCVPNVRVIAAKPYFGDGDLEICTPALRQTEFYAGDYYALIAEPWSSLTAVLECTSEFCEPPDPLKLEMQPDLECEWRITVPESGMSVGRFAVGNKGWAINWIPSLDGLPEEGVDVIVELWVILPGSGRVRILNRQASVLPARRRTAVVGVCYGGSGVNPQLQQAAAYFEKLIGRDFEILRRDFQTGIGLHHLICNASAGRDIAEGIAGMLEDAIVGSQPLGPVILLGHSWGANGEAHASRYLNDVGIGIDQMICADRTACTYDRLSLGDAHTGASIGEQVIQPDVLKNVVAVSNITATAWAHLYTIVAELPNAPYQPVWCARMSENAFSPGSHGDAEEDSAAYEVYLSVARRWLTMRDGKLGPVNAHLWTLSKVQRLRNARGTVSGASESAGGNLLNCPKPWIGYPRTEANWVLPR